MNQIKENIEFLNNDFKTGNALMNENNMKPGKDCLGFFDECDGAGQFYWFKNEHDLKSGLLNGWYARQTEERDEDYYDGAALLRILLEMNEHVDSLWLEISGKLNIDSQLLWTGRIQQLLTDENDFAKSLREDFEDFLIRKEAGLYNSKDHDSWQRRLEALSNDLDPQLPHNQVGFGIPSQEMLEYLAEYLEDYCWG